MSEDKEKYSTHVFDIKTKIIDVRTAFSKTQITNIIVVDENLFLGILTKDSLIHAEQSSTLFEMSHLFINLYLRSNFSLFDYLRINASINMAIFPIVDEATMNLIDLVSTEDIFKKFDHTGLMVEKSTVLILKKSSKSFVYSEVFQIAEANAAKIFGSYINSSNEEETEIVLNIYHSGLNELLQSYRRYDYQVVSYHEEDLHHETLKANSDYFSKYLTV